MFDLVAPCKNAIMEKNKKEWNRINNIWLDVKNKNKLENPNLYSTDSDNSVENFVDDNTHNTLTKCNSFGSYDDLINGEEYKDTDNLYSYEDETTNAFAGACADAINIDIYKNNNVSPVYIKNKYSIENAASLELDYSLNYNMKILTHIANYYEILKSKHSHSHSNTNGSKNNKTKAVTKMCKAELIKNIVVFETNEANHNIVYRCKKLLEQIDNIKKDKYFSSFVLFP